MPGGVIRTVRGPKGGVSLARPPEEIRLGEIIRLAEGSVVPVACVDDPAVCTRSHSCATRDVWSELKEAIDGVLESRTLQDLVECQKTKERAGKVMYHI